MDKRKQRKKAHKTISIIALNENGFIPPIKGRDFQIGFFFFFKQDQPICFVQETYFKYKNIQVENKRVQVKDILFTQQAKEI